MTSDLTESKAFEGSFVQEIAVEPRVLTVRYTIPTRWTARSTTETPLTSSCPRQFAVQSRIGWPKKTVLRTFELTVAL